MVRLCLEKWSGVGGGVTRNRVYFVMTLLQKKIAHLYRLRHKVYSLPLGHSRDGESTDLRPCWSLCCLSAFVTLLNGEQAQSAIQRFHQFSFRGRELTVQLQPTDALLCITNLPVSFTLEEFEELVRAYGNIERCFLVYSEVTGHSKGYGFVEYMKKDFAAKARLELLGRQMGASALFAQWMDVNLLASELIHSKCLCIDKLPSDYSDSEELLQLFSSIHKPVFCQVCIF